MPAGSGSAIGEPGASAVEDDSDAANASAFLQSEVIPAFVRAADSLSIMLSSSQDLTTEMHRAGINMRYLGRVADLATAPHVKECAELEMLARCCKRILYVRVCVRG